MKKIMAKYINADEMLKEYEHGIYDTTDLAEMLYYMPAADVIEVRHGKWIDPEDPTCYKCSVCGEYATQEYGLTGPIFWRYCPNCGAKME